VQVQIHPFLTLGLDKGKWPFSSPPFLFPGNGPQYPLSRRLVGPVKNLDYRKTEKLDPILSRLLEVFYGLQNFYYRFKTHFTFS
jgi:hypothetical protein